MALAAMFSIAATELLQSKAFYELYKWHICLMLLMCGAVLWLIGRALNAKIARKNRAAQQPQEQTAEQEEGDDGQPFLLVNLAYWGAMLIVFGIILIFIVPLRDTEAQTVAARTNSTAIVVRPTATNAPPTNNEAVVFPPLKLQGLSYRRTNPSVIINGRTYFVGNYIGDAKVVSIDEQQTVIELNGSFKVLELGK